MGTLNEAQSRDFVAQIISLLNEESAQLIEKGFDPSNKLSDLIALKELSDKAETNQQVVAADTKVATALSQEKLDEAYREASNLVDVISGLLGKESELVKKMRKFRK